MNGPFAWLVLAGIWMFLCGCTRTVTGGYEDSPDGNYRVWVRTFGAYGHAFTDYTRKTVRLRLVEIIGAKTNWQEKPLFSKEYHFQGSDVMVNTSWDADDNSQRSFMITRRASIGKMHVRQAQPPIILLRSYWSWTNTPEWFMKRSGRPANQRMHHPGDSAAVPGRTPLSRRV